MRKCKGSGGKLVAPLGSRTKAQRSGRTKVLLKRSLELLLSDRRCQTGQNALVLELLQECGTSGHHRSMSSPNVFGGLSGRPSPHHRFSNSRVAVKRRKTKQNARRRLDAAGRGPRREFKNAVGKLKSRCLAERRLFGGDSGDLKKKLLT